RRSTPHLCRSPLPPSDISRLPLHDALPICSGSFTPQSANDLAVLLRAGALPADLKIVEERTVGPGLGQDSIDAGTMAAIVGTVRSEEHTSELQSRENIVCRLLLEKKNRWTA